MTRGRFVLALDEGTTGTRALVFGPEGNAVATSYQEFAQHYPRPGWVEHDAGEVWDKTLAVARDALRKAKASATDVAGVGITNQRETVVAWDQRTGRPLARAIVWQDRRTSDAMAGFKKRMPEREATRRSSLRLDPYFSASKMHWLLKNEPKVKAARKAGTLRFGTMDAWLVWNLTGGRTFASDASNASRTLLLNLRKVDYDPELLDLFGVRRDEVPDVVDSSGVLAETDPRLLGASVPIAGIAGDQQAALFGQACFKPGMAKNTYGTGCFALVNAGRTPVAPKGGLLGSVAWRIKGVTHYALEGAVFVAGAAVQWLRDELRIIASAAETQSLAESIEDTGGVFLVPAFVGLGAPYWDPYARGLIIGMTRGTNRAHVARAALESISFQSADIVDLLAKHSGHRVRVLRADGGATGNDFLMQHQADVLGLPVERSATPETTGLGAAYLAGLGVDYWKGTDELVKHWRLGARFEPRRGAAWRRRERSRWSDAVKRSLSWDAPAGAAGARKR